MVAAPACLTFEEAASMPTVFITARAALRQVATARRSERVLLQAAAGGVGLAALQVLEATGAMALGTAGGPPKRALLRSLGVAHAVGSRDTGFACDLAVAAGGADVVLNSLTSPGMVGGALALLRRGGRLVEIGKRDVWSGAAVAAQRPDVAYSLLAVDFLPDSEVQAALRAVAAGAACGALRPLPLVAHPLPAVAAALRQLSQVRAWEDVTQ
jgi:NADPH:quinone reductase-like Zn-dependent oxidoreductase